jgi:hypothetical protein
MRNEDEDDDDDEDGRRKMEQRTMEKMGHDDP